MPPAVVAAGVAAAGTGVGAALQSRAANRATDAQERATREALMLERERERNQGARYDRAYEDYRNQFNQWLQHTYGGGASRPLDPAKRNGGQAQSGPVGFGGPQPGSPTLGSPAPATPPLVGSPRPAPVAAPVAAFGDGRGRTLADLGHRWGRA